MKAALIFSPLPAIIVAQVSDPSSGWGSILTAYGTAAPFALLCLWQINRLAGEVKELRGENIRLSEKVIDDIVPAAIKLTDAATEATQALQGATVMMHTLAGRGMDAETQGRFTRLLRKVERKLDEEDDA